MSTDSGRRGFFAWLAILASALVTAAIGAPAIAFVVDPLRRRRGGRGGFVRVARLADLGDGEPRRLAIEGPEVDAWIRAPVRKLGAVWLVRDWQRFQAFTTICPHLGCAIDHRADDGKFACPCHGSVFAADGRREAGPSPRDMDALATRVRDGWVEVRYERYRQGTRARIVAAR